MKELIFAGLFILLVISSKCAALWAFIEFILYLAKDNPFNWWSIWVFLILAVMSIVAFILMAVFRVSEHESNFRMLKRKRQ